MLLHVSPQAFSSMQAWHMAKPQGHRQQKGVFRSQTEQLQLSLFLFDLPGR